MSKIYCSIYNGIGNQLFGYALGLQLSKTYKKELIIDLTKLNFINLRSRIGLKRDFQREYELDKIGFIHPIRKFALIEFLKNAKFLRNNKFVIADFRKSGGSLNEVNANQQIHLTGWGDFNSVNEIVPEMRERFSANFEINSEIEEVIKLISEKNSVAVHVRRTDFLDPKINNFSFGICNDAYYKNAIKFIKEKIENPFFVFFSDDIAYVKENMKTENCYFVEGNAGYEDLYLMSLCKHFILANSTFSFWAAILNASQNKTVCVPKYWFNSPLRQAEFIPEEWTQIAVE